MSLLTDIFGSGFDLYRFLTDKARSKNSLSKLVIREIRDNIKRLEHRNKEGVNREKLIEMLSNERYLDAVSSGYNFNRLCGNQDVDAELIKTLPSAKKYQGWKMEQILNSIDEKIVSLRELPSLYSSLEASGLNITARLNNLYLLLVLAGYLIRKKEK